MRELQPLYVDEIDFLRGGRGLLAEEAEREQLTSHADSGSRFRLKRIAVEVTRNEPLQRSFAEQQLHR